MNIIFLHGNGGCTADMHWYTSAEQAFNQAGIETMRETLPDNLVAHEHIWIPHIHDIFQAREQSILIGHSSGAIAALRYAEQYRIYGSVIVSGYHTDLGDEIENKGGWFDRPWNWSNIRKNQNWIIQYASTDDPCIPIEEPRYVHKQVNSEYYEYQDRGHFTGHRESCVFPELIDAVLHKLQHKKGRRL